MADSTLYNVIHYNTQYNLPTDLIKDVNSDNKGGYFLATDEGCYWFLGKENILLPTPTGKSEYFKRFYQRKDSSLLVASDDALYSIN